MNNLTIFVSVFFGFVLFAAFAKLALQGPPKAEPSSLAISAVGQMVSLQGLSFKRAEQLLESDEYQLLKSTPELAQVAKLYRKERKELVLMWISLLHRDVKTLWSFRRFLVRSGVPATLSEEADIFSTAVMAVTFLGFMYAFTSVFGPFAFSNATGSVRLLVERISSASARILERLPQSGWPEVERSWQKSLA
jgi:hypothetical protein